MNNQVKYDLVEDTEEYKKIEEELEKNKTKNQNM